MKKITPPLRTSLKTQIARKGCFQILPSDKVLDERVILYRAILDRFLLDCFSKDEQVKSESKQWFSLENSMFLEVVDLADLELDYAVSMIKQAYKSIQQDEMKRTKTT